ncbi:unnamed protein product [Rotaria sordida]|uniref:Uncharacterized protein n=1 Tax=Rotaria sordida TaxID=392033 RepID=A0A813W9V2_9BILA|nr:unnamed protein product [Rotaria sordida]CAF0891983.1 unnamed protein product [Rotaria sordida]
MEENNSYTYDDHQTKNRNEGHEKHETYSYIESDSIDHFSIERHPQEETLSRTSQSFIQSVGIPIIIPKPNLNKSAPIQTTVSLHSFSSIDSSAEMAKYFPDAQTPSLSPFRHHQEDSNQQIQSTVTTMTHAITDNSTIKSGPYAIPSAPITVQQSLAQPIRPSTVVEHSVQTPVETKVLSGIPSYSSQIEGLSIPQAIVNDVIVDLQTKVLNESQQQYYSDSSTQNYYESLFPIYIRSPNPTIILRSDLPRLRHTLIPDRPVIVGPLQVFHLLRNNIIHQKTRKNIEIQHRSIYRF